MKMHPQFNSKHRMGNILTRKVKTSIMHIVDLIKAHASVKVNKTSTATKSGRATQSTQSSVFVKPPLTRKLTADEITEAELALKRLQAEKKRLEDLLNTASDRHLSHTATSTAASAGQTEEPSSNNNNVRKEHVRVPRYQQKVAFKLHNVFTEEVSLQHHCSLHLISTVLGNPIDFS